MKRLKDMLSIEVPVVVRLHQKSMPIRHVMEWCPGAIIELGKSADEELELMVNNKPIGAGRAVKIGENLGLEISFMGDFAARVKEMAKEPKPATAGSPDADLAEALLAGLI